MFNLDPRLAGDTLLVGELPLCRVLLMNDAQYPWLILVPRLADVVELTDLSDTDYQRYCAESRAVAKAMLEVYPDAKLNIAALGNLVPQLHLHVVARRRGDAAWPGPIWGHGDPVPLTETERQRLINAVAEFLQQRNR